MDATDLARENALLKARLAEVEASLAESQEANRRLQDILRAAQRETFGKRSEKLSPDQFNLPLEDAEFAQGVLEVAQEKAEAAMQRARGEAPRKPKRNRGHLPPHLPRGVCQTSCPPLDPQNFAPHDPSAQKTRRKRRRYARVLCHHPTTRQAAQIGRLRPCVDGLGCRPLTIQDHPHGPQA